MNCEQVYDVISRALDDRTADKKAGKEPRKLDTITTVAERKAMRDHVQSCPECYGVMAGTLLDRIKSGQFDAASFQEGVAQAMKDSQDPGD